MTAAVTFTQAEDRLIQNLQIHASTLAIRYGVDASKWNPKLGMCWLTKVTISHGKTGENFKTMKRGLGNLNNFRGSYTSKNTTYTSEASLLADYRKSQEA